MLPDYAFAGRLSLRHFVLVALDGGLDLAQLLLSLRELALKSRNAVL